MRAVGSAWGTKAWADPTQASTATVEVNFIVDCLVGGVEMLEGEDERREMDWKGLCAGGGRANVEENLPY